MRRKLLISAAVLASLIIAAFLATRAQNVPPPSVMPADGSKLYRNADIGISFTYPKGYVKAEGAIGETGAYAIEIVREEDAMTPENGEGPRSVSVRAYPSNGVALEAWLSQARESNYYGGPTSTATVAGKQAIAYPWEGLYQGRTTAFAHRDRVVLVTVTYDSPEDGILGAYQAVLSSLRLE